MKLSSLSSNQRRIYRMRGFILCEKIKQRRKYKFTIALCNLMKHITKVNEIQGNRGIVVTGGFGFDTNGNPISKRLS